MKEFSAIFRLLAKYMFKFEKGKKERAGFYVAVVFLGLFFLSMLAGMVLMVVVMAASFGEMGLTNQLIAGILAMGCVAVMIFGIISMLNYLYFSRDTEFFFALPVKASTVFLAKLTVVYLTELVLSTALLLPCLITLGVVLKLSVLYYVVMLLGILLAPAIPLLLASVIAIPLMYIVSFFKNKGAISSIAAILVFALFFGAYYFVIFKLTSGAIDFENSDQLIATMKKVMTSLSYAVYPLLSLSRFSTMTAWGGMSLGLSMLVDFVIFFGSVAVLVTAAWFISKAVYTRAALTQSETAARVKKGKAQFKSGSALKAFIKKEWCELIRTPAFAFQCLGGVVLCPLMAVFMNFMSGMSATADPDVTAESLAGMQDMMFFISLAMIMFFSAGMNVGASTCFTREGKQYYYCKMLPVDASVVIKAKVILYGILGSLASVLGVTAVSIVNFDLVRLICGLVYGVLFCFGFAVFQVLFDLSRPKLNWVTPNEAVKNNRNQVIPMLIGMVIAFASAIGPIAFSIMNLGIVSDIASWVILFATAIAVNVAALVFAKVKAGDMFYALGETA